ncbi:MAG: YjgP/YjgQ family permease [Bergeyella sp.]|nr:YjgP/YjgQ family permease [Bergeyella sp.]
MKIIDRYILGKLFATLGFMLVFLSVVVVIVDVQQKSPRIESNGFKISYFLLNYYPYWALYLIMTFMSILVFISVILFTSKMANNTEIVSIVSSGVSFHRFAKPYFLAAIIIASFALGLNHFILPWANRQKLKLEPYTMNSTDREKILGDVKIATNLSKNEYIFVNNYNRKKNEGNDLVYQKFDESRKLKKQIIANEIRWDEKKKLFVLCFYLEKNILPNGTEKLSNGDTLKINFGSPPQEIFPSEVLGQSNNTIELLSFIKQQKIKGNGNLNAFYNELYQRTSMPISIIILTALALSLSSEKKRGGIGTNIAIGIALAFVFVFSFEALKVVSENHVLSPFICMWLPNFIFAPIALYLYYKRAVQ